MRQHTRAGDVCYEPFSGSGTQIIAAEQLGRVCLAVEIEPRYVDVAVRRWKTLTGKPARLVGTRRTWDQVAAERSSEARKPCRKARRDGAPNPTAPPTHSRYCEAHAKKSAWRTTTASASQRGYGNKWPALCRKILALDPLCRLCNRKPSSHADHIKPKAQGGTDEWTNLWGVCVGCHRKKTAREGNAGKAIQAGG